MLGFYYDSWEFTVANADTTSAPATIDVHIDETNLG